MRILYGKAERPLRCAHLNQWDCGQYKRLLHSDASLHRMDWRGFAELTEQIRFDDSGQRPVAHPCIRVKACR